MVSSKIWINALFFCFFGREPSLLWGPRLLRDRGPKVVFGDLSTKRLPCTLSRSTPQPDRVFHPKTPGWINALDLFFFSPILAIVGEKKLMKNGIFSRLLVPKCYLNALWHLCTTLRMFCKNGSCNIYTMLILLGGYMNKHVLCVVI